MKEVFHGRVQLAPQVKEEEIQQEMTFSFKMTSICSDSQLAIIRTTAVASLQEVSIIALSRIHTKEEAFL